MIEQAGMVEHVEMVEQVGRAAEDGSDALKRTAASEKAVAGGAVEVAAAAWKRYGLAVAVALVMTASVLSWRRAQSMA